MDIPDEIRKLRSDLKLSQARLGKILNVATQSIWNWEHCHRTPGHIHMSIVRAMQKLHDDQELDHKDMPLIINTINREGHHVALIEMFRRSTP